MDGARCTHRAVCRANGGSEMKRPAFIHAHDVIVEQLDPSITRQILGFGDSIMTCRVVFESGAIGSVHAHPHSQTTYIESGRFRFEVNGAFKTLGPGDCVYIAPNLSHGATCIEAGALIDSFSPMRADFMGEAN